MALCNFSTVILNIFNKISAPNVRIDLKIGIHLNMDIAYDVSNFGKQLTSKRNSKIPKGQTEIVKSRTDKTMANKMKRKTNIEHTTLH